MLIKIFFLDKKHTIINLRIRPVIKFIKRLLSKKILHHMQIELQLKRYYKFRHSAYGIYAIDRFILLLVERKEIRNKKLQFNV